MKNNGSLKKKMDSFFGISKRGSSFKSETIGGLVNFLVLVYVMIVIPNIISGGLGHTEFWNAIFLGTVLSVIFTAVLMGLGANLPLVSAPGIGLSSYFATLVSSGTYSYAQTLSIALIAGMVYILITLLGLRQKMIDGLPDVVKNAIPAGIGLFILGIGLNSSNSGLLAFMQNGPTYELNGQAVWIPAVIALFGLFTMVALHHYKVKGSIFIGIIAGTILSFIISFCQGINPFAGLADASWLPPFGDLFSQTFFNFDFNGLFVSSSEPLWSSILSAVLIIFSYTLVDIFDTTGTLFGATKGTSLVDQNGQIVNAGKAYWVDSTSTVFGAMLGVPGCTVYVESVAGIKSGARTGLSSLLVGILFIMALFTSPLVMLIPAAATAPALIFVGLTMFESVLNIRFESVTDYIPAIFTILIMPLTNNISYGIGAGLIFYALLMLLTKKGKKVHAVTYILAVLFVIFFVSQNLF